MIRYFQIVLFSAYAAFAQDKVVVPESLHEDAAVPGPAQPAPTIGTGVLSGSVVSAKTKEPLRKASVTLGGADMQLTAITDASGSFTFRALPAGTYAVSATRDGISNRSPAQIQLKDGDEKDGVTIALPAAGAITGRVTDDDDKPVPGCRIQSVRTDAHNDRRTGRRAGMVENSAPTDDQGQYRIEKLPAGRYVVRAWCRKTFPAPHGFLPRNDPMTPVEGYAQATYGGALLVAPGAEINAIDFHVRRVPLYILTGTLSGADPGLLQAAQLSLVPQNEPGPPPLQIPIRVDARGHFTIRNVAAGSYELTAFVMKGENALEGSRTVEAGKAAITESNLQLSAVSSVSGRIDSDDPGVNFENIQLTLIPLTNNFRGRAPRAQVGSDGTFEFKAVLSGHFRLNFQSAGYLKSLSVSGREVSPFDFELGAAGSGPMHIQMGAKMATIQVTLSPPPPAGQTVAGILYNPDAPEAVDPRNLAVSDANGHLSFSAAPGKYRLLAINSSNPWMLVNQTGALHSLEGYSVAVEVTEGDQKQITATVVPDDDLQKALDAVE